MLYYKDIHGKVEFSDQDMIFHGKLLLINDLVTFEGESVIEIKEAFEEAVDDYLDTCKQLGREPQKPLSGKFNARIGSELHRAAIVEADRRGESLNDLVIEALQHEINV